MAGGTRRIHCNRTRWSEATRMPVMYAFDVLFPLAAVLLTVFIVCGGWR